MTGLIIEGIIITLVFECVMSSHNMENLYAQSL